jgi:hypothetical protein
LIFLLLFGLLYVVERRTVLGRAIHAIGGNPAAAELSGLNVRRARLTTYAVSGACGVIIVSQVGLAVPYLGSGYELDTIAAAVVGGVSLSGGGGQCPVWRPRLRLHWCVATYHSLTVNWPRVDPTPIYHFNVLLRRSALRPLAE